MCALVSSRHLVCRLVKLVSEHACLKLQSSSGLVGVFVLTCCDGWKMFGHAEKSAQPSCGSCKGLPGG